MPSPSFNCYCIEHNRLGYCLFIDSDQIKFMTHPIRSTYFSCFEECYTKFKQLEELPLYTVTGQPIDTGVFSIVEVAIGAYSKPTKYSIRPFRPKEN